MKKIILLAFLTLCITLQAQTPSRHSNGVIYGGKAAAPTTPAPKDGQIYYNNVLKLFYQYDGSVWKLYYDDTEIQAEVDLNTAKVTDLVHPLVETAVPVGAVFTDTNTIYDDTVIQSEVDLNTAKVTDLAHPLVETAVPVGAVFTDADTVYDDTTIQSEVDDKQDILAEGAFVDGDKTKLNSIETGADITDTANVTSSGALMDTEVTNLAQVKSFDTTDYATASQGSTADTAEQSSNKNANGGYAGLDGSGKISSSQLPALAITDTFVVSSQAAMLALTVEVGDVAVRTDLKETFVLRVDGATVFGNWTKLETPTDEVASVFGRSGVVTAQSNDYTFSQLDNIPTTVAGYGITDVYTETEADAKYLLNTTDTLDGTLTVAGVLEVESDTTGTIVAIDNENGEDYFTLSQSATDKADIRFGDNDEQYGTMLDLSVKDETIHLYTPGTIKLGDNGFGNSTMFTINDVTNQFKFENGSLSGSDGLDDIALNVKDAADGDNPDNYKIGLDNTGGGTFYAKSLQLGDAEGVANGTNLSINSTSGNFTFENGKVLINTTNNGTDELQVNGSYYQETDEGGILWASNDTDQGIITALQSDWVGGDNSFTMSFDGGTTYDHLIGMNRDGTDRYVYIGYGVDKVIIEADLHTNDEIKLNANKKIIYDEDEDSFSFTLHDHANTYGFGANSQIYASAGSHHFIDGDIGDLGYEDIYARNGFFEVDVTVNSELMVQGLAQLGDDVEIGGQLEVGNIISNGIIKLNTNKKIIYDDNVNGFAFTMNDGANTHSFGANAQIHASDNSHHFVMGDDFSYTNIYAESGIFSNSVTAVNAVLSGDIHLNENKKVIYDSDGDDVAFSVSDGSNTYGFGGGQQIYASAGNHHFIDGDDGSYANIYANEGFFNGLTVNDDAVIDGAVSIGTSLDVGGDVYFNQNAKIYYDNDGDRFAYTLTDQSNSLGFGAYEQIHASPYDHHFVEGDGGGYTDIYAKEGIFSETIQIKDGATSYFGKIIAENFTDDHEYKLPNHDGTLALTSDLGDYLPLTGGALTDDLTIDGKLDLRDSQQNTFIGFWSGYSEVGTSVQNIGLGFRTLYSNTLGDYNFAAGTDALYTLTDGDYNVAISRNSLGNNSDGSYNIGIGYEAGYALPNGVSANTSPSSSIFIGRDTRAAADSQTNQIVIGDTAIGNGSNTVTLGNDSITDTYLKGDVTVGGGLLIDTTNLIRIGDVSGASEETWIEINGNTGNTTIHGALSVTNGLEFNDTVEIGLNDNDVTWFDGGSYSIAVTDYGLETDDISFDRLAAGIGTFDATDWDFTANSVSVTGSVQVGDDTSTAVAGNVGATRYRISGNNSYMDMVMQTGASTYAWVNIQTNSW
jgi:hypothetical protein